MYEIVINILAGAEPFTATLKQGATVISVYNLPNIGQHTINVSLPGEYQLVVVDSLGCEVTVSYIIIEPTTSTTSSSSTTTSSTTIEVTTTTTSTTEEVTTTTTTTTQEPTTTTTSTTEEVTTTTTTTEEVINLASCDMILATTYDAVAYSVTPSKLQSLGIPSYNDGNDIASTANKLWIIGDDGYDTDFYTDVLEWDITYAPFTASFNRTIRFPYFLGQGLCAIDDTTLIFTHYLNADPSSNPSVVCTADISGVNPVVTTKFNLEFDSGVMSMKVSGDFLLTTGASPKLIVTTENDYGVDTWLYQYDWATGDIEIKKSLSGLERPYGLSVEDGKLYVFDAKSLLLGAVATDVYEIDLNYPYDLTFIERIDDIWTSGATQQPSCIDVEMITTTTTTTTITPTTTTTTTTP